MMTAVILIADGTEEMEYVTVYDGKATPPATRPRQTNRDEAARLIDAGQCLSAPDAGSSPLVCISRMEPPPCALSPIDLHVIPRGTTMLLAFISPRPAIESS